MTEILDIETKDAEGRSPEKAGEFADLYTWHEGMDWNPVEKVILERRSVRKFKDKQVPEKLVRRVLEAGRFAPSAGNSQPWRFIVVRDKKMIDEMEKYVRARCKMFKFMLDWQTGPLGKLAWVYSQIYIRLMPNLLHPIPFGAIRLIADGKLKLFHGAPTVILILKDKRGAAKPELDCGVCGQNIVLAAHSLGLGTCWVGFVEVLKMGAKWRKLLRIEWPYDLVEGITLGYPVGKPDGMVSRELREMDWWENGEKRTVF
jgi:nitroreductase